MARTITIQGVPYSIPEAGESPDWGTNITNAIEAISNAVNTFSGAYDVAPQTQDIASNNDAVAFEITNLNFPKADVLGVVITYSVYRSTDTVPATGDYITETGLLTLNYDSENATWIVARGNVTGDAQVSFDMDDTTDILQMTCTTLAGTLGTHAGKVSFRALSVLNS